MPATSAIAWEDLRQYRTAKPFRPFFIVTKSGQTLEVLDALAFGGVGDRLAIAHPRTGLKNYRLSDVTGVRLMTPDEMTSRLDLISKMRRRA